MNGLTIQWVKQTQSTTSSVTVSYPLDFTQPPIVFVTACDGDTDMDYSTTLRVPLQLLARNKSKVKVNRIDYSCNNWFMFAIGY